MLVLSDIHFALEPLRRVVATGETLLILGDLVNLTDYRTGEGAVADVLGSRPLRFAVEATGHGAVLDRLIGLAGGGARIAMVGIFHGRTEIDPNAIVEREIELRGCSVFADEQREAVALLPALAPKLQRLASAPIGLDAVPQAYRDLLDGRAPALKTIIRP